MAWSAMVGRLSHGLVCARECSRRVHRCTFPRRVRVHTATALRSSILPQHIHTPKVSVSDKPTHTCKHARELEGLKQQGLLLKAQHAQVAPIHHNILMDMLDTCLTHAMGRSRTVSYGKKDGRGLAHTHATICCRQLPPVSALASRVPLSTPSHVTHLCPPLLAPLDHPGVQSCVGV